MPIGPAPLIPLHRVIPDPEARFQRFGVNDSQLIGKPILSLPAPAKAEEDPKRTRTPEEARPTEAKLAPDYARTVPETRRAGPSAEPGSLLDVKA